jgi:hypothetical protein
VSVKPSLYGWATRRRTRTASRPSGSFQCALALKATASFPFLCFVSFFSSPPGGPVNLTAPPFQQKSSPVCPVQQTAPSRYIGSLTESILPREQEPSIQVKTSYLPPRDKKREERGPGKREVGGRRRARGHEVESEPVEGGGQEAGECGTGSLHARLPAPALRNQGQALPDR